jgi:hypothetical protein
MDITRYRGDTYADEFTLTDVNTGLPVDLTGCSFKLTVDTLQSPPDSSTNLYTLIGTIDTPVSGVVEFAPNSTQADLVGYYFYDVQLIDASGAIRTILSGSYQYLQDITK